MPINYVGNNVFTSPLVLPLNTELGDAVVAGNAWKALADRTVYNRDSLLAQLLGLRPDTCDIFVTNTTVSLRRLSNCWAKDVGSGAVTLLAPTLPLTVTPMGLVNNTIYYLYLSVNAGVYAIEVTTTVPDAKKIFKTGTETHKYLGAFLTSIGTIRDSTTVARETILAGQNFFNLITGPTVMNTPFVPLLPVTTTNIYAKIGVKNPNPFDAQLWLGPTGATILTQIVCPLNSSIELMYPFSTNGSQSITYRLNPAGPGTQFQFSVLGWAE